MPTKDISIKNKMASFFKKLSRKKKVKEAAKTAKVITNKQTIFVGKTDGVTGGGSSTCKELLFRALTVNEENKNNLLISFFC